MELIHFEIIDWIQIATLAGRRVLLIFSLRLLPAILGCVEKKEHVTYLKIGIRQRSDTERLDLIENEKVKKKKKIASLSSCFRFAKWRKDFHQTCLFHVLANSH